MTRTIDAPPASVIARFGWHRPLLWLSVGMIALAAVALVGLVVDQRSITGMPLWAKPLKFSLSVLIYSVTLSWLLGQLPRARRIAWWSGTVAALFLAVEMIVIYGAAFADTTSHFNVSTPFSTALWGTMAVSIVIVWSATILVAVLLFRAELGDPARSFAIRSGLIIAVIGMGLAFLMTSPTAAQLSDFQGIAGAHTVGLADGGPGLPLLGWSTVAGDLRIPHFVGMHAMQVLPILALLLELGSRRLPALRDSRTRLGILVVTAALYLGVIAVLTAQALSGRSIVSPDAAIATVSTALFVAAAVAIAAIVVRGRRLS
ncbi:hypothetical protein F1C58_15145 [Glaciihabitans sp. INWT7]|uniref:hypothetical protein n=1 Tax=Glaciihabitans sp. INWT7 TaxID=2596912 RepID=UPI001628229B|nr:hypothetical protein [Glaciihabitans sp. INWT7]QNE48100.1 hypothetical protein F1C58_15145 [Glaciihabitans sp. INWT7]